MQRKRTDLKHGYRGVHFDRARGTYRARLNVGEGQQWLGRFETAEEAAWAYDVVAKERFGVNAILNFPDGIPPLAKKPESLVPEPRVEGEWKEGDRVFVRSDNSWGFGDDGEHSGFGFIEEILGGGTSAACLRVLFDDGWRCFVFLKIYLDQASIRREA